LSIKWTHPFLIAAKFGILEDEGIGTFLAINSFLHKSGHGQMNLRGASRQIIWQGMGWMQLILFTTLGASIFLPAILVIVRIAGWAYKELHPKQKMNMNPKRVIFKNAVFIIGIIEISPFFRLIHVVF
jgi:hypothetical protein